MRIGIDLGGTKIEVLALDDAGAELIRCRRLTPAGDYVGTLDVIAELIALVEATTGRKGSVGVAAPGAISPATGLVKNANSTVLNGKAFDRDLAARLGRPVKIENDANCFALSEASDGAGAGAAIVFGVILGTGVGGGLMVDGKLVSGRNRVAGEWGHNPLPFAQDDERPGPPCYCGKFGCIESFLSGPGLARDHFTRAGAMLTAHDIAAAAAAGETEARHSLARYRDRLARGLAGVINIVDPDVIALGGGLSNVDALYSGLPELIARYALSDRIDTEVRRAIHGDSSGVRGAAWLWPITPA